MTLKDDASYDTDRTDSQWAPPANQHQLLEDSRANGQMSCGQQRAANLEISEWDMDETGRTGVEGDRTVRGVKASERARDLGSDTLEESTSGITTFISGSISLEAQWPKAWGSPPQRKTLRG